MFSRAASKRSVLIVIISGVTLGFEPLGLYYLESNWVINYCKVQGTVK